MNILQVIYVVIATYFFSFGIFYLAQSIFVFKKLNRYLYFSIASLFGTVFVLCTAFLSTSTYFEYTLTIHRIKFVSLLWAASFWIYSTYDIFFKKSKIPHCFAVFTAIWTIPTIFSNLFFSVPIKLLTFKVLSQSMIYLHGTTGVLYKLCVLGILFVFSLTAYKIFKEKIVLKRKIKGILIVAPAIIGGIHDSLVLNGYLLNQPLILEFIIFIFLIATFSIFFSEQRERYVRIKNINQELEFKVREKTNQLSNASKQMWNMFREQKQASKLKTEILQIAAHDMKSPLQGIVGYSELLMVQFADNEELVKRLGKILKSSDDMLVIIQNLLEQEVKKAEKQKINISDCNISQITEFIVDRNYPAMLKKEQHLISNIQQGCFAKGDKDRILEIIDNLLNNAIKYTALHGEIRVSVENDSGNIKISVKDNGPGLSSNDQQLLFKKYQRLTPKPTGGEKSTGLGLYIVSKFVKMLNGRIEVNSEIGKGTEFVVFFPSVG